MRKIVIVFLILAFFTPALYALDGFSIGPYYGYCFPVINDWAEPGSAYGINAKTSLMPFLGVGLYFNSRAYDDVELVYFDGEPFGWTEYIDGGDVTSYGINLYLGKTGGMGLNYYAIGGIGSHKWKRDYKEEDSKVAYSLGLGLEYVLPMNLGIEARGIFEAASAGNKSMWRSAIASVGVNYHFKLGPM